MPDDAESAPYTPPGIIRLGPAVEADREAVISSTGAFSAKAGLSQRSLSSFGTCAARESIAREVGRIGKDEIDAAGAAGEGCPDSRPGGCGR